MSSCNQQIILRGPSLCPMMRFWQKDFCVVIVGRCRCGSRCRATTSKSRNPRASYYWQILAWSIFSQSPRNYWLHAYMGPTAVRRPSRLSKLWRPIDSWYHQPVGSRFSERRIFYQKQYFSASISNISPHYVQPTWYQREFRPDFQNLSQPRF